MQTEISMPTPGRVAELEKAFSEFTQTSLQLECAYRELEERATALSIALADANNERLVHLAEKEKLADRLQRLLEALPAAVIVIDDQGCIGDVNAAATMLLGKNLSGSQWTDIVRRQFAREGECAGEFRLRDGRVVSLVTRKLAAGNGRILLLTDITESRHLQKLLQRNQRLTEMGQMNARLAHQLRTPLATAILYVSQLKKHDVNERSQRYAGKIINSLQLLERMVNDMLRFAGGGQAVHHEQINVNDLFAAVAAQLESQLDDGIELEFGAPDGTLLRGDREALTGALLNLATNAIENGGSPLRIRMDAQRQASGTVLRVTDNGPGLEVSAIDKIFEPFFTTRAGGTGLGLAVVDSVARSHGGRAFAENAASGGAVFSIQVPASNPEALHSGQPASGQLRESLS